MHEDLRGESDGSPPPTRQDSTHGDGSHCNQCSLLRAVFRIVCRNADIYLRWNLLFHDLIIQVMLRSLQHGIVIFSTATTFTIQPGSRIAWRRGFALWLPSRQHTPMRTKTYAAQDASLNAEEVWTLQSMGNLHWWRNSHRRWRNHGWMGRSRPHTCWCALRHVWHCHMKLTLRTKEADSHQQHCGALGYRWSTLFLGTCWTRHSWNAGLHLFFDSRHAANICMGSIQSRVNLQLGLMSQKLEVKIQLRLKNTRQYS